LNYIYPLIEERIIEKSDISTNNNMVKLITDVYSDVETKLQPDETFEKWVTAKLGLCYTYGNISRSDSKPSFESTGAIRAIVFSFDGTLTSDFIANIWESIWVALGYTRKEFFDLYGSLDAKRIARTEWYKNITNKLMAKELHIDSILKLSKGVHLLDGTKETFFQLKKRNIKIYIISNSIHTIIREVLCDSLVYISEIKANEFMFSRNGFLIDIIETKYAFNEKRKYCDEISNNTRISPSDILFVGSSYSDELVYKSNVNTLCINPVHTNPYDRTKWHSSITKCDNLIKILDKLDDKNTYIPSKK